MRADRVRRARPRGALICTHACRSCRGRDLGHLDPPKGETCGGRWFNGTCGDCFSRACCAKGDACAASASCRALHDCIAACQGSEPCLASCERAHPGGVSPWNAMAGCLEGACRVECGL